MKAKLVIEMPDDCGVCVLNYSSYMCFGKKRVFADDEQYADCRPVWCPLEQVDPFEKTKKIVEEVRNHRCSSIEDMIRITMEMTGCEVTDLVLCHQYDGLETRVWLELKESEEHKKRG